MRKVLLVDGAHLYMSILATNKWPDNVSFDRSRLLQGLLAFMATSSHALAPWRTYWIDAPPSEDRKHEVERLAEQPNVHVLLGTRNSKGTQKGVDARVMRVLNQIATWSVETEVHLVAGDNDYIPAVEDATSRGLRIILWSVEGTRSVTPALQYVVDEWHSIPSQPLESAFDPQHLVPAPRAGSDVLYQFAYDAGKRRRTFATPTEVLSWLADRPSIPTNHYGELGWDIGQYMGLEDKPYIFVSADDKILQEAYWRGHDEAD
jgi:uncharacterized LabA/DUF88 family protein